MVNSEPLNCRGTYDYFYMLLPKLDGNMRKVCPENGMPELEDHAGGFADQTAAAAALKERLQEVED